MASPPPAPRSTRSRPSLPPTGIPSASSSSSSSRLDGDHHSPQSANAIAHAQYTASLSGLGKKDRGGRSGSRKKSSGQDGAERMITDNDPQQEGQAHPAADSESAIEDPVKDEDTDQDGARALASSAPSASEDRGGEVAGYGREAAITVVVRPPSPEQENKPSPHQSKPVDDEPEEDEDDEEEGADVTRCVCGITESDDMMIQCDTCNVWQHGACVGIPTEEETPDEYFCEKCQPGLHVALKKWMRTTSRGRGGIFLPPSASDLHRLNPDDKVPPNQSKRWTHDLPNLPPLDGNDSDSESDRGGGRGRRSRSNRNRSKQPVLAAPPAGPSPTAGSSSAGTAQRSSHRPLPFPPRKPSGPPSAGPAGGSAGGPSSMVASSSSSHPPPHPSTSSGHPPPAKSHKRQVSSSSNQHAVSHRQLSPIAPSSSQSPPPAKLKSPKKRSTMNSRDAGLEEAIRESLLAAGGLPEEDKPSSSRRSPSSNGSIRDRSEPTERKPVAGTKRGRRGSVESSAGPGDVGGTGGRKGKKSKKDVALTIDPSIPTSPSSHPGPSSSASHQAKGDHLDHHGHHKAKHPNQYTYRPKTSPSTAAFPDKPPSSHHAVATTIKELPSPSKPVKDKVSHASLSSAAHEHGTRRNGNGSSTGGGSAANGNGSGGRSSTPANGGERAERPGRGEGGTGTHTPTWGIPDHLSHLSSCLPSTAPQPLLIGVNPPDASSTPQPAHLKPFVTPPREEPPTKIKWPGKRMTVGEMRKRVRAILDFVGRWPVGDRPLPLPASMAKGLNGEPRKTRADEVEELVRDLISFEQRFGSASFGTSGLRSGGDIPGAGLGAALSLAAAPPVVETVVAVEDVEMVEEAAHVELGGVVLQVVEEVAPTATVEPAV